MASNWIESASKEIHDEYDDGHFGQGHLLEVQSILEKHCPFKPDTAYVEVKTETFGWVEKAAKAVVQLFEVEASSQSDAMLAVVKVLTETAPNAIIHKEPPLLQCSSCNNTESCAGAMARVWNHGRCQFCAGYFKVVRA